MITTLYKSSVTTILWTGLKLLLFILFCWLLNERIVQYEYSDDIGVLFVERLFTWSNALYFVSASGLMFLNWYLESYKWQRLCASFKMLNITQASKSILLGLAFGVVTPGRIGEYGGRMLLFKDGDKALAVQSHILSSLSQNMVNLFIGVLGGSFFLLKFTSFSVTVIGSLATIGFVFTMILAAIYFKSEIWTSYILKFSPKWLRKYMITMGAGERVDTQTLNIAIAVSLLRYVVFCTQYALLLYFFGCEIDLVAIYSGITLIYFIQSGIPLPPFLSMLARGEIAIVVWSIFYVSSLSILSATFTLWIINLLIPALIGTFFLLRLKHRNNDYNAA